MITYIKGEITLKTPTYIIVETGGIGYHINISLHTYGVIEKLQSIKIHTYLSIKEDSHTLYGFAEEAERSMFILLISVSGVGTNTARVLLSSMNTDELRSAIMNENLVAFSKVKGIGPKTAKRIILDLKEKVIKESGDAPSPASFGSGSGTPMVKNSAREEAIAALVTLGFNKIEVQKVLTKIQKDQPEITKVEDMIRIALKMFS